VPSSILVFGVLFIFSSDPSASPPHFDEGLKQATRLTVTQAFFLLWLVLVVSLVVQPLQFRLVQLLEGYWESTPLASLAEPCAKVQALRRTAVEEANMVDFQTEAERAATTSTPPPGHDAAEADEVEQSKRRQMLARAGRAASDLRYLYPRPDRLMPTRLGNALRAAEDRAGERYGLDTVTTWPRLFPLIPDKLAAGVIDLRNQLDLAARLSVTFFLLGSIYLGLL
jgi:hypothetical protein